MTKSRWCLLKRPENLDAQQRLKLNDLVRYNLQSVRVSFPALMNLLGHSTPKMSLLYSEFTQTDLQREFRAARSQPWHLLPPPRAATSTIGLKPDLASTMHALQVAQHVLEIFRRTLSDTGDAASAVLDRLANRLTKIAAELRKLDLKQERAKIGRISRAL